MNKYDCQLGMYINFEIQANDEWEAQDKLDKFSEILEKLSNEGIKVDFVWQEHIREKDNN